MSRFITAFNEVADKQERHNAVEWLEADFLAREDNFIGNPYSNELIGLKYDHHPRCLCQIKPAATLFEGGYFATYTPDPDVTKYWMTWIGVDIEAEESPQWIA
jgi:hypothetical protein